jgi:predicted PurR-regulated permease PerM
MRRIRLSIERAPAVENASDQEALATQQFKARQAWQRLWLRIRGITPSGLIRFLLVLIALAFLFWLIASAFQSLALFLIGIMLAYISLPAVNWLDRFLPRWLATLLVILGEIALILLFLTFFISTMVQQASSFVQSLPSPKQLQDYFNQLAQQARGWPEPIRVFLQGTLKQTAAKVQSDFTQYIVNLIGFAVSGILGVLTAFSFLLSLLVLPTWLFAVLNNQRRGVRIVDRLLPDWLRPDFWAVARIIDRTFRVYFRELLVMAVAVGIATYAGLVLLTRLGVRVPFPILLAMLAGFTDFIPSIGMLLGTIPAVLFGLVYSWQTALAILVLYVVIHFLRNWLLAPMFTGGSITIHSVILLVILVIASQFGLIWLFLGAPLAQVVYDLYRYVYGRVSDPPRPAGVLPGDPIPATRGRSPASRRTMVPFPARPSPQEHTTQSSRVAE